MKKQSISSIYLVCLFISIFLLSGCISKNIDETESIVNMKRELYDICYDHDASSCKPLFDYLVKKKIITEEERNIIDEKEYTDENIKNKEIKELEEKLDIRIKELGYTDGDDIKIKEYSRRLGELYWQFPFSEKAKNERRIFLNRYYDYIREQIKNGVELDDVRNFMLIEDIGWKNIMNDEEKRKNLFNLLNKLELKTKADVEKYSIIVLNELYSSRDINLFTPIKEYLYNNANINKQAAIYACAFYLRDEYLASHSEIK